MNVQDFNPKEETTVIEEAILLEFNCFKAYFIVPLISIITFFIYAVVLYWSVDQQKKFFYSEADSIKSTTHIYIRGKGKS